MITLTNMFSNVTANAGGTLILYGTPDIKVEWDHATGSSPNDRIVEIEGFDVNSISYPLNNWSNPYTVQYGILDGGHENSGQDNYCAQGLTGSSPFEWLPFEITVRVYNTTGGTIAETATFTIEHRQAPSNNASLMGAQGINWTVSSHGTNGTIKVCWPNFDTTSECWKGSDSWCGGQKTLNSSLAPGQWRIQGNIFFKPGMGTTEPIPYQGISYPCCINNCISHTLQGSQRPQDIAYIDFSIQYQTCQSPLEYRKQSVNSSFFASPQPTASSSSIGGSGGSSAGASSMGSQPLPSASATSSSSSKVGFALPQPIGSETHTTPAGQTAIPLCPQNQGRIYAGTGGIGYGCQLGGPTPTTGWWGGNYCDTPPGEPNINMPYPHAWQKCPSTMHLIPPSKLFTSGPWVAFGEIISRPTIYFPPPRNFTGCCFNEERTKIWKVKSVEDVTVYGSHKWSNQGFVYRSQLKAKVTWDIYAASDIGDCFCDSFLNPSANSSCHALCGRLFDDNAAYPSSITIPRQSCWTSGRCSAIGQCNPSYKCPSPAVKKISASLVCEPCPPKGGAHQAWIIDFDPCFERWDDTLNARNTECCTPNSFWQSYQVYYDCDIVRVSGPSQSSSQSSSQGLLPIVSQEVRHD